MRITARTEQKTSLPFLGDGHFFDEADPSIARVTALYLIEDGTPRPAQHGDALGDAIEVRLWIRAQGGIAELQVVPRRPDETQVTTALLRALPLAAMERRLRSAIRKFPPADDPYWKDPKNAIATPWRSQADAFGRWEVRRPGRAGRNDLDYAKVAARYVAILREEAEPMKKLAKEIFVGASQARNILYEARNRGLLTNAPAGRAGGELTEKAVALLSMEESK